MKTHLIHCNPVLYFQTRYKLTSVQFTMTALWLVTVQRWWSTACLVPASRHTGETLTRTWTVRVVCVTLYTTLQQVWHTHTHIDTQTHTHTHTHISTVYYNEQLFWKFTNYFLFHYLLISLVPTMTLVPWASQASYKKFLYQMLLVMSPVWHSNWVDAENATLVMVELRWVLFHCHSDTWRHNVLVPESYCKPGFIYFYFFFYKTFLSTLSKLIIIAISFLLIFLTTLLM